MTRDHNTQNKITGIDCPTTPTFGADGNMTGDEIGRQFIYDAWNWLVEAQDDLSVTLETFSCDGLNRRVTNTIDSMTTDLTALLLIRQDHGNHGDQ